MKTLLLSLLDNTHLQAFTDGYDRWIEARATIVKSAAAKGEAKTSRAGLPRGPYHHSCKRCSLNGTMLSCTCYRIKDHKLFTSSLDYESCDGREVDSPDGILACDEPSSLLRRHVA